MGVVQKAIDNLNSRVEKESNSKGTLTQGSKPELYIYENGLHEKVAVVYTPLETLDEPKDVYKFFINAYEKSISCDVRCRLGGSDIYLGSDVYPLYSAVDHEILYIQGKYVGYNSADKKLVFVTFKITEDGLDESTITTFTLTADVVAG